MYSIALQCLILCSGLTTFQGLQNIPGLQSQVKTHQCLSCVHILITSFQGLQSIPGLQSQVMSQLQSSVQILFPFLILSNSVSFSYPFKACRIAVRGDVPAANPRFKFLLFFFHPFRVCRTYLACSHRWCPSCKSAAQIVFPFHPSFHPFRVCRTFPACSRRWWPINAKSCVQILTTSFN